MIDREILDNITHVVTHRYTDRPCADGVASAILLTDALSNVKVTFVTHNTPEYEGLEAHPGMLFCDITPPPKRTQEFVDVGAIVLDHHAHSRTTVEAFGKRGVFADLETEPGVSGAVLAFREVWAWRAPEGSATWARAHDFAKLAGIRDTWQKQSERWDEASAQAAALCFYPWSSFDKLAEVFAHDGHLATMLEIGTVLLEQTKARTKSIATDGFARKTSKDKLLVILPTRETSDAADLIEADLVVGFKYHGGEKIDLELSCRSRGDYDVGAFCKSLGGGGHVHAAGARIHVSNGELNPYEHIFKLVEDYERGL